jgi:hypothetical protein
MRVTVLRFARTIQTRPYHSATVDATAELGHDDSATTVLMTLRNFVDAQLDAEIPDRPRRQADDDIPI